MRAGGAQLEVAEVEVVGVAEEEEVDGVPEVGKLARVKLITVSTWRAITIV